MFSRKTRCLPDWLPAEGFQRTQSQHIYADMCNCWRNKSDSSHSVLFWTRLTKFVLNIPIRILAFIDIFKESQSTSSCTGYQICLLFKVLNVLTDKCGTVNLSPCTPMNTPHSLCSAACVGVSCRCNRAEIKGGQCAEVVLKDSCMWLEMHSQTQMYKVVVTEVRVFPIRLSALLLFTLR